MAAPIIYKCDCGYRGPDDRGFCPRCEREFRDVQEQVTRDVVSGLLNDLTVEEMTLEVCDECGQIKL